MIAKAMTQLDLDLLRSFVAVVEVRGFTRAGERLCRTQSTVSLHIKRLEKLVGHRLLERTAHHVMVTDKGEVLFEYAQRILHLHDEACTRLMPSEATGIVRVGLPEGFASRQLPQILQNFKRLHPGIRVEVRSALSFDLHKAMRKGDLDIILARRSPNSDDGERIWSEPLVWVDSRDHKTYLNDPLPLVMFPRGCVFRPDILKRLEGFERVWKIVYTSTSLAGVQSAVRAGMGVAVLAQSTLLPDFIVLGAKEGFPQLCDTEIAFYRSKTSSKTMGLFANFMRRGLAEEFDFSGSLDPSGTASAA